MTTLPWSSSGASGWSRRRFLQAAGGAGALAALLPLVGPAGWAGVAEAAPAAGPPDAVAATWHRVLLRHTRWVETQWDATAGTYRLTDQAFTVVLGNALLLTRPGYDADLAGIDAATLKAHTLATLTHFAASNRLAGGDEWGTVMFFDSTFELYFQLAGRLLWDDLDAATRANLDAIAAGQAAYTTALGTGDDPLSPTWTPHGTTGGYVGDTKLEEMGVYAQSIASGLAWLPTDPRAADWRATFGRWSRNETGLPPADAANPTLVDGVPVSANTARNVFDTFMVENHGTFEPHYQCELWRTSARNGIHFITAGRPLPEVFTAQPNADRLWRSIRATMSDAGEPFMPMIDDRTHLYGRDVIPLAFLAHVLGDRTAAWAESALAARMEAYQAYPPADRITKFSGEPKYEPEARAEIAISYLLHEWRAGRRGGAVQPFTAEEAFAGSSAVIDFGAVPALVVHQTPNAWAAASDKAGYTKFAWAPAHDDWLFDLSGAVPAFLPTTALSVTDRRTTTWTRVRDGFDASATVVDTTAGRAAFVTLPGGSVVYTTTGLGPAEAQLQVHNLTMPGVPGLSGARTYRVAGQSVTVPAADAGGTTPPATGRVDTLTFPAVTTRWVRLLGITPDPKYGYSVYEFAVRDGADGADLAQGRPTTASSSDTGKGAPLATDGDPTTRWAVAVAERSRADSWLAVDLGVPTTLDRASVQWEAAAGRAYDVQVSDDGSSWTSVAHYPVPAVSTPAGWIDVDGRAGFVVRGGRNPITVVAGDIVTLSDGPASNSDSLVVEGHLATSTGALAALAAAPAPTADVATVRAALVEDHLVLVNLGDTAAHATVTVPQAAGRLAVFPGTQVVVRSGVTQLVVDVPAATGVVLPPRFTLQAFGKALPTGLTAVVADAASLRLTGARAGEVAVAVTIPGHGTRTVAVRNRTPVDIAVSGQPRWPLADLALGATTFPTTPLPPGMTSPSLAVDGDPTTGWTPGPSGRMVVDLGAARAVDRVELVWSGAAPAVRVETSDDGLSYRAAGKLAAGSATLSLGVTTRYVAVAVPAWRSGGPVLRSVTVTPG